MKKTSILFLVVFLNCTFAKAQYFQTGQDPSSVRWKQINTTSFQVIFPEEFEVQAQRISYVLEKVYNYGSKSLNFRPRKVSVILHSRTVNSNGLVAWTPKRMELFTTPNQQIYAQDWLEQLALHEFRHLVQMDKIQKELPALLRIILGEQAAAVVVGAYLPFWFLEGDAVVTETSLSKSGRGRMASFSMPYRAQLAEKGKYSFDKAYLGSYKDYVPDYYKLGFWMVGKGREKYGPDLWINMLKKIGEQPLSLTPLNSSIKKATGNSTKQLYNTTFDELRRDWKQNLLARSIDSISVVSPEKRNYTEYQYPEFYKDSLIFAYRSSIDDIGRFVLIHPDKSEKTIYTPGSILDESVSMKENMIIWSENRADLRWAHANKSVIRIFNIENKQSSQLIPENKLFSPVISPDLKSFAAVEVDHANNFFLSVFDLETGKIKFRFNTPDNQYFFTPCWDENGENLFVVCLSAKGKYLAMVNMMTKKLIPLTDFTFGNLKNPVYSNHRVIFSADFSGIDNIYSIDIERKKITEIASVSFGADYPAVSADGSRLLFSNYFSGGFQLAIRKNKAGKDINDIQLKANPLAENLAVQEDGIPSFSNPDSVVYPTRKYSKLGHLFNFHSWAPAYINVNSYDISPGVSMLSQNVLGTAETHLGYDYNIADRTGTYRLGFNYSGWFPVLSTEFSIRKQAANYYQITNTINRFNQVIASDTVVKRFSWTEATVDLDVQLPFNFSAGKYSRMFIPEAKYSLKKMSNYQSAPANYESGSYQAMSYRIYFYNILRQSSQSLMPKWGQQFDLVYRHTPFIGNDLGTLSGIQSVLYFPGFSKNAGFKIYQGYQEKSFTKSSTFSNFIRSPRGYQTYQNNKMYSLSVDYKFPFLYPDLSIGKLAYIKRLKSSLFYDYAWMSMPAIDNHGNIYPNNRELKQNSFGIELTSDFHALRFFAPIEMGFRSLYRTEFHDLRFDLLLSIDFNGF